MNHGYIYILSNKSLRFNLFKIGCTERFPEARRKELSNSSSIPLAFVTEYSVKVKSFKIAEKRVHLLLSDNRFNSQKEFFEVDLEKAKEIINSISIYMDNYEYYSETISNHPDLISAAYTEKFSLRRGYAFTLALRALTIKNTLFDKFASSHKGIVDGFADSGMISDLMGMPKPSATRLMRIFTQSHVELGLIMKSGQRIGVFNKLVYHRGQMAWSYTDEYLKLFYNQKI